jgi:hypothetical protein
MFVIAPLDLLTDSNRPGILLLIVWIKSLRPNAVADTRLPSTHLLVIIAGDVERVSNAKMPFTARFCVRMGVEGPAPMAGELNW